MLLAAESVAWLRDHLQCDARAQDLDTTYGFAHPLNGGRTLLRQEASNMRRHFHWEMMFTHPDSTPLLEETLSRTVVPDGGFFGQLGRGRVAYNEGFELRADSRRQGFGKALHEAECNRYREWNIAEIQVDADRDGRVVWPHLGFEPKDPGIVARRFREWAEARGLPSTAPARAADYPEAFLLAQDWLPLYKAL